MKLEVGQFARTKLGTIGKIENNSFYIKLRLKKGNYIVIEEDDIVKASYNIIDILEVGDYVNGYKIEKVNNNLNEHKGICNSLDTYLWGVNDLDEFEEIVIFEIDIKSVITHEQMEQMAYKVGE